mmetsp:Transcript_1939/g.3676  ORF Transcript_1939/g.3676 Transcript_1939/m.3676 type:complete len:101 (-) Transcript_1939:43-345(-)
MLAALFLRRSACHDASERDGGWVCHGMRIDSSDSETIFFTVLEISGSPIWGFHRQETDFCSLDLNSRFIDCHPRQTFGDMNGSRHIGGPSNKNLSLRLLR